MEVFFDSEVLQLERIFKLLKQWESLIFCCNGEMQVELRTVDGLVKDRTQCAPNGYYFIPVYDKVLYSNVICYGWLFNDLLSRLFLFSTLEN